ncbi:protein IQ-DOMAIN 2-like isoform X2 [Andrographis paniculata]|uniref:protein IQ-DOMAIN 2-like isoform X2 n=1 Tax=Andrographis paniculata TaxID=175694 RepID=UPI0021E8B1E3|nr:protein IQ-DOMAIN 2-like isoform X2 [Andrographis paniculata]
MPPPYFQFQDFRRMWKERAWCSSVEDVLSPVSIKKKPKKKSRSRKKQDVQEKPSPASDQPNVNSVQLSTPIPSPGEVDELNEVVDVSTNHAFSAAEAAEQETTTLQSLKGPARLKSHVNGASVKRRTSNALKYIRGRSRLQFQVRARRIRMSQENHALQRQQFHAKMMENLKVGDEWNFSLLSKEQIMTNLIQKYGAAMRRERSLAYSHTHQPWIKSTKYNPFLGWIWLDRWMSATQPWEMITTPSKDHNNDCSAAPRIRARDPTKCLACRLPDMENPSASTVRAPHVYDSPGTAGSKIGSSSSSRKLRTPSHSSCTLSQDNDSRNAITCSSRKNKSRMSPFSVPSYMAPTHSALAKFKRHSYPPTPAGARRHVGPSMAETGSAVEENIAKGARTVESITLDRPAQGR